MGVKVTLILYLLFAAKVAVQVVDDTAKSPAVEIAMLFNETDW